MMLLFGLLALAVLVLFRAADAVSVAESLYCGRERGPEGRCYEILGVTRDADAQTIKKTYRRLSLKHHPDKAPDAKSQVKAAAKFKEIANAYAVLSNEGRRQAYDYFLDNPDSYYAAVVGYAPVMRKVNPLWIPPVIILLIDLCIWVEAKTRIERYRRRVSRTQQFKNRVAEEFNSRCEKKKVKKEDKAKLRTKIVMELLESEEVKGACPQLRGFSYKSLILYRVLCTWPIALVHSVSFQLRWFVMFTLMHEEYGDREKEYLICKNVKDITQETLEDEGFRTMAFDRQLWVKEKAGEYTAEREEEEREARLNNNKYKQMKRAAKKERVPYNYEGPEDFD
ncbi:unnamed protein product [Vitrella brassicaformis CCMP3155]|uniref:J domain-containing protein n=2 Tax=Vitrella brassicaformis TaxID=1169539 RepID=A0A0G4EBH4_VITBC|nr:unnamed protein product [Vitrella brassicaformis CCMP3155]|mmetsp:Transcript_21749/g.53288  ORF Transcript_21749/g.53288 Transcript_21749/m.53288 type:complete len:339 (+) Transcript_21749:63-1079(+)|eukprot:CEL93318.1 unnamed protein product [Vitrella brassicaformis CCMP3155]